MGLDFSHGGAHWAYGGFGQFREALALHEGFDLDTMVGFGGDQPWEPVATALKPLLNHSDCDGDLSPEECAQVAPRLRDVIKTLWPEWDPSLEARIHRGNGLDLAAAMEQAAAAGERLEFC